MGQILRPGLTSVQKTDLAMLSSLRQCAIYSTGGQLVLQDKAEVVKENRLVDCYDTVLQIRSFPQVEVFDGLHAILLARRNNDRSQAITFDKPCPLRTSSSVSQ